MKEEEKKRHSKRWDERSSQTVSQEGKSLSKVLANEPAKASILFCPLPAAATHTHY